MIKDLFLKLYENFNPESIHEYQLSFEYFRLIENHPIYFDIFPSVKHLLVSLKNDNERLFKHQFRPKIDDYFRKVCETVSYKYGDDRVQFQYLYHLLSEWIEEKRQEIISNQSAVREIDKEIVAFNNEKGEKLLQVSVNKSEIKNLDLKIKMKVLQKQEVLKKIKVYVLEFNKFAVDLIHDNYMIKKRFNKFALVDCKNEINGLLVRYKYSYLVFQDSTRDKKEQPDLQYSEDLLENFYALFSHDYDKDIIKKSGNNPLTIWFTKYYSKPDLNYKFVFKDYKSLHMFYNDFVTDLLSQSNTFSNLYVNNSHHVVYFSDMKIVLMFDWNRSDFYMNVRIDLCIDVCYRASVKNNFIFYLLLYNKYYEKSDTSGINMLPVRLFENNDIKYYTKLYYHLHTGGSKSSLPYNGFVTLKYKEDNIVFGCGMGNGKFTKEFYYLINEYSYMPLRVEDSALTARAFPAYVQVRDHTYIFGGKNSDVYLGELLMFDTAKMEIRMLRENLGVGLRSASQMVYVESMNKLMIFGGFEYLSQSFPENFYFVELKYYNAIESKFANIPGRSNFVMVSIEKVVILGFGRNKSSFFNDVYRLIPEIGFCEEITHDGIVGDYGMASTYINPRSVMIMGGNQRGLVMVITDQTINIEGKFDYKDSYKYNSKGLCLTKDKIIVINGENTNYFYLDEINRFSE